MTEPANHLSSDIKKFQSLFQNAPLAILIADDRGKYVDANPAACELFGDRYETLIGKTIFDFVPTGESQKVKVEWSRFKKNDSLNGTFTLQRPDGQIRFLEYNAVPDFFPGLNISFLKDITKKKDAERALSESEIRYRLIARATSEATWDWDIVSGKVVRSTGANGCFGFRESEIDHSFDWWRSHIHVEDRDRVLKDLNTALVSDAETIGYQYRFQKKDGSYVSILDRGFVVRDSQGKPLRALGAMMDVTERIRAEEERGMLLKIAASDLDKMRDERENRERFVSTLTHDLRTPLTAARMSAQLVLRRPTDVILAQKGLSKVIASIDRAESMIRDLLDTHRIQAGEKLILKIEACDLKDIATTVLEDLTTVYGDWFILKMPNPVEGYWDREHIRRVIENLCSNAVKYGSPREHVTVSVLLDKGVVDISVHNLGKPISLANQNTLFQPFRRVMTAETSTHKGWGLGLTLVRGVAEAHGGSVKVESSTEKGTIFSVVIPQDSRSIESQTNDPNGQ